MKLLQPSPGKPIPLKLKRDLRRILKRGHPWVFADNLRACPPAPLGSHAILLDPRNRQLARGFYDSNSPLAFRVATVDDDERLNDFWAKKRLIQALSLRQTLFDERTTGYRLFNGEGDGLPGLVVDIYHDVAVLKLDGPAASGFWHSQGIAHWLAERLGLRGVYERQRTRGQAQGKLLLGKLPTDPLEFLENGVRFTVDVTRGQKTGFFLDQRDNRQLIGQLAAGKRVLNLFGYTGGFSVYAGLGKANHVTTVDLAQPAIAAAEENWRLNDLPPSHHEGVVADAFEFLEQANQRQQRWDIVVIDPPSFAPSKEAVKKAVSAYQKLVTCGARVTQPSGLLAMASCSSHVDLDSFLNLCEEGISKAKRRATLIKLGHQPADHPAPLVLPEFRYLKFVLMRVE